MVAFAHAPVGGIVVVEVEIDEVHGSHFHRAIDGMGQ